MVLSWLVAPQTKREVRLYARATRMIFRIALALAIVGFVGGHIIPSLRLLSATMLTVAPLLGCLFFCLRFSATRIAVGYVGRAARMYGLIAALALVIGICVLLLNILLVSGTFGWVVLVINCLSLVALAACLAIAVHWGIGL